MTKSARPVLGAFLVGALVACGGGTRGTGQQNAPGKAKKKRIVKPAPRPVYGITLPPGSEVIKRDFDQEKSVTWIAAPQAMDEVAAFFQKQMAAMQRGEVQLRILQASDPRAPKGLKVPPGMLTLIRLERPVLDPQQRARLRAQKKLQELKKRLEKLKEKARTVRDDAKERIKKKLAELKIKYEELKEKSKPLRKRLKNRAKGLKERLKGRLHRLRDRFKKRKDAGTQNPP